MAIVSFTEADFTTFWQFVQVCNTRHCISSSKENLTFAYLTKSKVVYSKSFCLFV